MDQFRRKFLLTAFKLFDLLVMIAMFVLAAAVVYLQNNTITFHEFLQMRFKVENYALFSGFIILWHLIFSGFGLYQSRRFSSIKTEIKDLLIATTLGTFAIFIASWIFSVEIITPTFLTVFWAGAGLAIILSRLAMRSALKWLRLNGRNIRYLLIVGTNERARNFARKIESRPELGYRLIGFADDEWEGNGDLQKFNWSLVADLNGITPYIRQNTVDEVVIALPMRSLYQEAAEIFSACEEQGVIVRNLSDIFTSKFARSITDDIEGTPLTTHYSRTMEGWQVAVKRILDIVISSALLAILSPLFLFTAIAIKLNSSGPVHYIQERVGLNKRRFRLYKFRTMVEGADQKQAELESLNEVSGPVFKIKKDPRITSVGKILRQTSIDELPQLFNVIKGDMSLVGPRPLPVRDYKGFDQDWHRRRFSVLPGITCLWQINGRSSIQFENWMELDMQYIDHWSLWLDFKILVKTVPAILKGSGAA